MGSINELISWLVTPLSSPIKLLSYFVSIYLGFHFNPEIGYSVLLGELSLVNIIAFVVECCLQFHLDSKEQRALTTWEKQKN